MFHPTGDDLEAVEELSGGAGAELARIKVGQDLLERGLERCRIGDPGQGVDGGGFGGLALVVITESPATEGGAAAAASIGMAELTSRGGHRQAEVSPGEFGGGVVGSRAQTDGGWGSGGIDSRDSRI